MLALLSTLATRPNLLVDGTDDNDFGFARAYTIISNDLFRLLTNCCFCSGYFLRYFLYFKLLVIFSCISVIQIIQNRLRGYFLTLTI